MCNIGVFVHMVRLSKSGFRFIKIKQLEMSQERNFGEILLDVFCKRIITVSTENLSI